MNGELNYLTVKAHIADLIRAAERARMATGAGSIPSRRRRWGSIRVAARARSRRAIGSARP